jgi:hypothetical protein
MITLELEQAREDLPALAEKALLGEDVFIAVGDRRLRLAPVADAAKPAEAPLGPRRGRGALRGLVVIADAFDEPWSAEEMGETKE